MYLVALIDWFSRYVVEWQMGDTMEEGLVLEPVRRALGQAQPGILNSDRGSQFTAAAYAELVTGAGVRIQFFHLACWFLVAKCAGFKVALDRWLK